MNFNLQESHLQLHCTYEQWRSTRMNLPNSFITFQKLNLGNFNLKNALNSNHLPKPLHLWSCLYVLKEYSGVCVVFVQNIYYITTTIQWE